ncbi:MAG: hypothetical protein GY827_08350 [Cytophagales bacterium]|nr:hypothetical protein [Cytophagales bacterium]
MRKFEGTHLGNLHIVNQYCMELDGNSTWIFHGDIFDTSVKNRGLAIIGGYIYNYLVWLNRKINKGLNYLKIQPITFSKALKSSVKKAATFMSDFEENIINTAIQKNYDHVICGAKIYSQTLYQAIYCK